MYSNIYHIILVYKNLAFNIHIVVIYLGKANSLSNNATLHTKISEHFNPFNCLIGPYHENNSRRDLFYLL